MLVEIVVVVVLAALAVGALGRPRVSVSRKPDTGAIQDVDVAKAYERISRWPQFRFLRRMIVRKLTAYRPRGLLLDIGCGPGQLTLRIARTFPSLRVLGFDTMDEMICAATARASEETLGDRVAFRLGDVSALPLCDETVDFAVSSLSLHHWTDPANCLVEIHRVLKPGGQILLFDLRRDARRGFYWLLTFARSVVVPRALRRVNEPLGSALASYTREELDTLLAQSPFSGERIEGGLGWVFVWAEKYSRDSSRRAKRGVPVGHAAQLE